MPNPDARQPADLLALIPYLFEFHPEESLVAVALNGPGIAFAVRFDLPDRGLSARNLFAAALQLVQVVVDHCPETVSLVAYAQEESAMNALGVFSRRLTAANIKILHQLRVTDGRFWSYLCGDVRCCPPGGRKCPPPHSLVAAKATFAGAVALPSRKDLEARIAPVAGLKREAMNLAEQRAIDRLTRVSGESAGDLGLSSGGETAVIRVRRLPSFDYLIARSGRKAIREAERRYREGGRLNDDEMAWFGVTLASELVRDYAWNRAGQQEWEVELWSDVLRRIDPAYAAPAATLLAFVAWRSGKGALASIAVGKALEADPGYSMAELMHSVLCRAIPPTWFDAWPAFEGVGIYPADADEASRGDRAEHWRRLLRSARREIR